MTNVGRITVRIAFAATTLLLPRHGTIAADPPAAAAPPAAPAAAPAAAAPRPDTYAPLDVPDWAIHEPAANEGTGKPAAPWILIVDDPQCPYCMQLSLGIEKARETHDGAVSNARVVHVFYPLPYHDQSAHIVEDAFCLEATRAGHDWSAASYLQWLTVEPWKAEPGWKDATIEDLAKDGGLFDKGYDSHRVLSSRRRDFQTGKVREEAACAPGGCKSDPDCAKLCETAGTCRAACPSDPAAPGAEGKPSREDCLKRCTDAFVSSRYRQLSKAHQACLLESGPGSAQAKTAAAFEWCVSHKIPGTPTVFVGHPRIGFRTLGDSDDLTGFFVLLRKALEESRAKLNG